MATTFACDPAAWSDQAHAGGSQGRDRIPRLGHHGTLRVARPIPTDNETREFP